MLIYQVEHEAILKKREKPGSSITWNEYKSMSFTLQVCSITQHKNHFFMNFKP